MVPALAEMRYLRAFAGVRPLVAAEKEADGRDLSRGFEVLDHEEQGVDNFVTVTGGKLTTYRLMAEKTADLVCRRLGVKSPCRTRTVPLPSNEINQWTEPGHSSRFWLKQRNPKDALLCECEMVPVSVVDEIVDLLRSQGENFELSDVGLRSRMGRGSCQGTFCTFRVCAHLFERGLLEHGEGLSLMKRFLGRRWHGLRPVLWGSQLAQEELQEALHCGLFNLEL
jgi:glycerol-3-phosphate dehydrogenase